MKIYVKNTLSGLKPLYESDAKVLRKFALNETLEIEVKKQRNYRFHKKFFALLNLAFQNQEKYQSFNDFRYIMTMKAGYYREIETDKGIVYLPDSISFANMDDLEFEKLYDSVCDVIMKEIIQGITKEEIQDNLINFM